MPGRDTAECVWGYLRVHTAAAALRAMIYDGANNIYESGDLTPERLQDALDARRTAGQLTRALAISVQDAGEDPTRQSGVRTQDVVVRVFDRMRGYHNIRTARIELMRILRGFFDNLTSSSEQGVLQMEYSGRTGHRFDQMYAVEYEAISYTSRVTFMED